MTDMKTYDILKLLTDEEIAAGLSVEYGIGKHVTSSKRYADSEGYCFLGRALDARFRLVFGEPIRLPLSGEVIAALGERVTDRTPIYNSWDRFVVDFDAGLITDLPTTVAASRATLDRESIA